MKKCPSCNRQFDDEQMFCQYCGIALTEVAEPKPAENSFFCRNCGHRCNAGTKFCPECGSSFLADAAPVQPITTGSIAPVGVSDVVLAGADNAKYGEMIDYLSEKPLRSTGIFSHLSRAAKKKNENMVVKVQTEGKDVLTADFAVAESCLEDKLRIGQKAIFRAEDGYVLLSDIAEVRTVTMPLNPGSTIQNVILYGVGKKKKEEFYLYSRNTNDMNGHWDELFAVQKLIESRLPR